MRNGVKQYTNAICNIIFVTYNIT